MSEDKNSGNREGLLPAKADNGVYPDIIRKSTSEEVPIEYKAFEDIFSNKKAVLLPEVGRAEYTIETTGKPLFGLLYSLSEIQLKALQEYLKDSLAKGWIGYSTSPAGTPILFVPKKDGGLYLYIDYRGLNKVTIKNCYLLPLINKILDCLVGTKLYTKLDLKDTYYRIRIRAGDK